jgi:hypothetical protein
MKSESESESESEEERREVLEGRVSQVNLSYVGVGRDPHGIRTFRVEQEERCHCHTPGIVMTFDLIDPSTLLDGKRAR